MEIATTGDGNVGLGLALNLGRRGLTCRVYEAVPEVKELGVGSTLLPRRSCIPTGPHRRTSSISGSRSGRPFDRLDDFISQEELRALSDQYKRIAGYSIEDLAAASAQPAT